MVTVILIIIAIILFFGSGAVLFNKPRSDIETVNDLDGNVVNGVVDMVNCMFATIKDFIEELKTMPEDEFEQKISQLTLEQQALARKIRGRKEGN